MVKKGDEDLIPEFKAPIASVSPIFSNTVAIFTGEEVVIIDFGLSAPSYPRPYDVEDNQAARICMTWSTVEIFQRHLRNAISDHKKEIKSQKT